MEKWAQQELRPPDEFAAFGLRVTRNLLFRPE